MGVHGCECICIGMDLHGSNASEWMCMHVNGLHACESVCNSFACMCMDLHGFESILMDFHAFERMCMQLDGIA